MRSGAPELPRHGPLKSSKGKAQVKQNKGAKAHTMKDPHPSGRSVKPTAGQAAVEIRGTNVHARQVEGVTRPSKRNAGSHDAEIREHAEHRD